MSHALYLRRRFLEQALTAGGLLAFGSMIGCGDSDSDLASGTPTPTPTPSPTPAPTTAPTNPPAPVEPTGVPTAAELASDPKAVVRYEAILKQLFDKEGVTKDSAGRPKTFEEMEKLASDVLPTSNGVVGHYAYTVPGDSIEHIKVAARYWQNQFGIGPFFAIGASEGKQDYFPITVSVEEAKALLMNSTKVPRAGEDGKVTLQWPVIAAVCKASPNFYVEFNAQVFDVQSTFRDMYSTSEGGLHHFAVITDKYADDKTTMMGKGFLPSSNLITSVGVNYFDARHTKAGSMFELFETNVFLNFLFDSVYATCKSDGAKNDAVYQSQIESNIIKADVTKAKAERGLTIPFLSTMIDWAATEGPLRNTDPRAKAYRDYVKAKTGVELVPLP